MYWFTDDLVCSDLLVWESPWKSAGVCDGIGDGVRVNEVNFLRMPLFYCISRVGNLSFHFFSFSIFYSGVLYFDLVMWERSWRVARISADVCDDDFDVYFVLFIHLFSCVSPFYCIYFTLSFYCWISFILIILVCSRLF